MDNPMHPDPNQELPAPPEEKLLRAPTFWEKYGKAVTWGLVVFLIAVASISGTAVLTLQKQNTQPPSPLPSAPVTVTLPPAVPTIYTAPRAMSCTPRPACLDATPRCMIPETDDMCPPMSPTPTLATGSAALCTLDAKVCPDGTTVGRVGPACEFAPCPQLL